MFLRFEGVNPGPKCVQNRSPDSKTFRDRFLMILELFWFPFWELPSITNKLKIERIFETILDAIFDDLGSKVP